VGLRNPKELGLGFGKGDVKDTLAASQTFEQKLKGESRLA
jgi:hypothetical protein